MAKIKTLLLCVALYLLYGLANAQSTQSNAISKYLKSRSDFIKDETRLGLGGKLILNPKETRLNNFIMKLKAQDIQKGLFNPLRSPLHKTILKLSIKSTRHHCSRSSRICPKGEFCMLTTRRFATWTFSSRSPTGIISGN